MSPYSHKPCTCILSPPHHSCGTHSTVLLTNLSLVWSGGMSPYSHKPCTCILSPPHSHSTHSIVNKLTFGLERRNVSLQP
jgi:hypothetical protein